MTGISYKVIQIPEGVKVFSDQSCSAESEVNINTDITSDKLYIKIED